MKKLNVEVERIELTMIEPKNLIKMSKVGKMMSLPIPLVMKIILLF
jgi:hypothetical protein